jgi:hypothetical protein
VELLGWKQHLFAHRYCTIHHPSADDEVREGDDRVHAVSEVATLSFFSCRERQLLGGRPPIAGSEPPNASAPSRFCLGPSRRRTEIEAEHVALAADSRTLLVPPYISGAFCEIHMTSLSTQKSPVISNYPPLSLAEDMASVSLLALLRVVRCRGLPSGDAHWLGQISPSCDQAIVLGK